MLYFRFFFLSNDELLEILSETANPLRVQPHLKKCFEGIALLQMVERPVADPEVVEAMSRSPPLSPPSPDEPPLKQVHVVEGMCSSAHELVRFPAHVVPAAARGLVERWLIEVERGMRASLRSALARAVRDYRVFSLAAAGGAGSPASASSPARRRVQWALDSPGQVVLATSAIYFTAEVTQVKTHFTRAPILKLYPTRLFRLCSSRNKLICTVYL